VLLRSLPTVAFVLLMLGPAGAQEPSVPLPRDKPGVADEVESGSAPSSCIADLAAAGVVLGDAAGGLGIGRCAIEEAVVVAAVDTRAGRISLPAQPVLDCRFAAILAQWLREVASPVADSVLGSPIDALVTGPGHQCRNRAGGRLSEHAIGHAIDVTQVRLADGRSIRVEALPNSAGAERTFLRAISASACGYFTTVLGPGSDAAHADHLHLDVAERSVAEFRICMAR
jgi:hypothetical protein